jgi:RNA polymerase sigma-70 factor (ECF subfamily)
MTNIQQDFLKDVALARTGDSLAFARLYTLVYKDLYSIACYSLRNSHDASDVVSDTIIDAFATIGKLRDEKAFRNWIMKILYNKIKRYRFEYTHKNVEYNEDFIESDTFNYETTELNEALETLDQQSRLILSLAVLGGYTSEEISKICEVKATTIRSRLARIKEKLRVYYDNEEVTL